MKNTLIICFLLFSILLFHAQNTESYAFKLQEIIQQPPPEAEATEFVFVDESATFHGGDLNDFLNWVQENLVYPKEDLANNIFGRATVQFAVNSNGEVVNVNILRGLTPTMDAEVKRVILSSPLWEPAKQNGENVAQQFTIPVVFTLPE